MKINDPEFVNTIKQDMAKLLKTNLAELTEAGKRHGLIPAGAVSTEEAERQTMAAFLPQPVPVETIVEVACDRNAMLDALAEFGYRLVCEEGSGWDMPFTLLVVEARRKVMDKLKDEIRSKQGYRPPA